MNSCKVLLEAQKFQACLKGTFDMHCKARLYDLQVSFAGTRCGGVGSVRELGIVEQLQV